MLSHQHFKTHTHTHTCCVLNEVGQYICNLVYLLTNLQAEQAGATQACSVRKATNEWAVACASAAALTCPFIAILTVKVIKSVKSLLSQFGLQKENTKESSDNAVTVHSCCCYLLHVLQSRLTLCHPADEARACGTSDNSLMCRRLPSLLCSLMGRSQISRKRQGRLWFLRKRTNKTACVTQKSLTEVASGQKNHKDVK